MKVVHEIHLAQTERKINISSNSYLGRMQYIARINLVLSEVKLRKKWPPDDHGASVRTEPAIFNFFNKNKGPNHLKWIN